MEFNATFLVSAVSFILFTLIMNKIFYKPLEKVMSDRENFIKNTLEDAEYSSQKAASILKDRDEHLKKSAQDAKQLISDKISAEKNDNYKLIEDARFKSQTEISNAKNALNEQSQKLNNDLNNEAERLAEIISSKILSFNSNRGEI